MWYTAGRLRIVIVLVLGLGCAWFVRERAEADIADARARYLVESQAQTTAAARRVEHVFQRLYEGLRTMARLPGVRGIARHAENFDADARTTAKQLDTLLAKINRGEGTLGKFASDTLFYQNAQKLLKSLQEFADDLKKNPGKIGLTVKIF